MQTKMHNCGGTILTGGSSEQTHMYCDRCHAYIYMAQLDAGESFPRGTDEAANRAAWDEGEDCSPE